MKAWLVKHRDEYAKWANGQIVMRRWSLALGYLLAGVVWIALAPHSANTLIASLYGAIGGWCLAMSVVTSILLPALQRDFGEVQEAMFQKQFQEMMGRAMREFQQEQPALRRLIRS